MTLGDGLRRARELYLAMPGTYVEHAQLVLLLIMATRDRAVAFEALVLLDQCVPDDAKMRSTEEAIRRGLSESKDPWCAGYAFAAWVRGTFKSADGEFFVSAYDRRPSEVAAIIGKACALVEAMAQPPRRRFTSPPAPVAPPAPNAAVAAIRSLAKDTGYVQDPEEDRDDG